MTALAFAIARNRPSSPARAATPPAAGRWFAAMVVGVLLAAFSLSTRGGR